MKNYNNYIISWKKKLNKEHIENQKRIEELRRLAFDCAKFMVTHYKVKRVYLFGSLVQREYVHKKTDIDLAVVGLIPKVYFSVLKDLWDLVPSGVEVDLIPLEDAHNNMKKHIIKEGELLYEQK
jgi:predicted nucleotidyltransferase